MSALAGLGGARSDGGVPTAGRPSGADGAVRLPGWGAREVVAASELWPGLRVFVSAGSLEVR